jgi:hypothetical protein
MVTVYVCVAPESEALGLIVAVKTLSAIASADAGVSAITIAAMATKPLIFVMRELRILYNS